jgi:hypothetical protein
MYGLRYHWSKSIPWVISTLSQNVCPSSTVITPLFPTLSIASAIISHTSLSCAAIFATWAISSFELIFLEFFVSSSQMSSHAFFIPFLSSTALTQFFMYLSHSFASA